MKAESSDVKGDGSLSPRTSCHSTKILNVAPFQSQSVSGIILASTDPTYQTQSQQIGTEVDSSSGLFQASSAPPNQTKRQIGAEEATQSQRAVGESETENKQTIAKPVHIADFVQKFYRYVGVWSTRLPSKAF